LTIKKLLIYGQMSLSTIAAILKTAYGLDTFKVDVGEIGTILANLGFQLMVLFLSGNLNWKNK